MTAPREIPHYIPPELRGKVEPTYARCPPELVDTWIPKPIIGQAKTGAGVAHKMSGCKDGHQARSFMIANSSLRRPQRHGRTATFIVTDERVARFVADQVGSQAWPPFTCAGVERGGRIVAGVIFNCFTGPDVEITVASERGAMSRGFLRSCGRYVFETLRCQRASLTTESTEIVRFAQRLGGEIEGMKRNQFGPGRDGFIVGILKEDWVHK